jgi:hypothetical protein
MKTFSPIFLLLCGALCGQEPAGPARQQPKSGGLTLWHAAGQAVPDSPPRAMQLPVPTLPFEVSVLPNPCSDWLEVNLKTPFGGPFDIELCDTEGRPVLRHSTRPGEKALLLAVARLPADTFYLTIRDADGQLLATHTVEKI